LQIVAVEITRLDFESILSPCNHVCRDLECDAAWCVQVCGLNFKLLYPRTIFNLLAINSDAEIISAGSVHSQLTTVGSITIIGAETSDVLPIKLSPIMQISHVIEGAEPVIVTDVRSMNLYDTCGITLSKFIKVDVYQVNLETISCSRRDLVNV